MLLVNYPGGERFGKWTKTKKRGEGKRVGGLCQTKTSDVVVLDNDDGGNLVASTELINDLRQLRSLNSLITFQILSCFRCFARLSLSLLQRNIIACAMAEINLSRTCDFLFRILQQLNPLGQPT